MSAIADFLGRLGRAVSEDVGRRKRNRLMTGMLDSLDAAYGPVDEALVARHTEMLR